MIHKVVNDKNKLVDLSNNLLPEKIQIEPFKKEYSELIKLSKKGQMTPSVFNKVVLLILWSFFKYCKRNTKNIQLFIKDLIIKYESSRGLVEKRKDLLSDILLDTSTGKKRKIRIYNVFKS